jgi:AraC-like DNA-binding protein
MYRARVPDPPLSQFVELLWLVHGPRPPHAKERVLPTGALQLIINLAHDEIRVYDPAEMDRSRRFPGSLVAGAGSRFGVIDAAIHTSAIGVAFKPGGAFPFLGVPARDLRDADTPLETLWGAGAGELRDRLLYSGTPAARFGLLQRALLAHARSPLERRPEVALALGEFGRDPGGATVEEVAARAGLSHRRFIEVFADEVGLTPKVYRRVRRFQRALRTTEGSQPVDWPDVALECGYYDQAHLARDFRAFAGLSPTAYLTQRGDQRNHVPLP